MREIYFDNSATTKICDKSLKQIIEVMKNNYANPSSLHFKGFESERILNIAREKIAKKINADRSQIYFTSGGTESNNIAILGTVSKNRKYGDKIVTTSIEHPSVLEPIKYLEKKGYEVKYIRATPNGIDIDDLVRSIDDRTVLVSIMMVNNETGEKLPIEKIRNIIKLKKSRAIFHVDAIQSFCKLDIDVSKLGIDLLSVSSHKVHGPKGVGALYVKDKNMILPVLYGGGQESNLRSGTQPVSLISGFAQAVPDSEESRLYYEKIKYINDYLIKKIQPIHSISINSPSNAIPHILNLSIDGIPSEVMMNYLSDNGIYVSSGSACSKNKRSRVLSNMGLPDSKIRTAIRISISRYNTIDEVDELVDRISSAIKNLSKNNF